MGAVVASVEVPITYRIGNAAARAGGHLPLGVGPERYLLAVEVPAVLREPVGDAPNHKEATGARD